MVKRYDIGENEAAIAMHRVDHDLGPPDARDDDRRLPFADDREIALEARIAVESQEVPGHRRRSFSGSAGGIELASEARQPVTTGRANGRENVCKAVEILVVACRFKNKQK